MKQRVQEAGKYRHRITIRNAPLDSSRNTFGERLGTGTTVATVWAEKQDWSGRDSSEFERATAEVQTRFLIRYRSDIKPIMEVVFGSEVYFIESILDLDGTRRELILSCRRVVE